MDPLCDDLLAEYEELAALCAGFTPEQWRLPTGFFHWTPWDEIAHLLYFDEAALQALADAPGFQRTAAELNTRTQANGEQMSDIARDHYGHLDGAALVAAWRAAFVPLVQQLRTFDPRARLPWYGPTMSARSFATARLMECWAHGQDVWDAVRRQRPVHARLRHIAHLGVSTFGWSFAVHGQTAPEPVPFVALDAPAGDTWAWGEPSDAHAVRGPASDFCLVVTQRRHPLDTGLVVHGASAEQWLALAQCFAGAPATGPAPKVRRVAYADD